jgi:hypothetical protein
MPTFPITPFRPLAPDLDLSPLRNALAGYQKGSEQAYEGETAREMGSLYAAGKPDAAAKYAFTRGDPELGMRTAQFAAQQAEAEEKRHERAAVQFAKIGALIEAEKDPDKQKALFERLTTADPRIAAAIKSANLPAEIASDPVVWSRYWGAIASPYRDKLEKAKIEADIANARGASDSGNANMARLQHQLQIDLAKAKSQMEVAEILQKAKALGIDFGGDGAAPSPAPSPAPAPPVRPGITATDPRFAAPPASTAAPAPAGVTPRPRAAAPADPYLQLTRPPIPPEQEEAARKRRAGISVLTGDIKGAGKIMAKEEDPKEYQTKDASFAERMARSEISLLETLGRNNEKYNPADWVRSKMPDMNLTNSQEWRQYIQSAREWIAAKLRKDTGAAVTDTEWNLYFPTYFPQPGDDIETQNRKRNSRIQDARGMRGSSGPAFDRMYPHFDKEMGERLGIIDPKAYGGGGGAWKVERID